MSLQKHALELIGCYLVALIGGTLLTRLGALGLWLSAALALACLLVAWRFDAKLVVPNAIEAPGVASPTSRAVWGVSGIAIVLAAQVVGSLLEQLLFGLAGAGALNQTLTAIHTAPGYLISLIIAMPILEELTFRRVLFGNLAGVTGKFGAALIAGLLFALATNPSHWLMGTLAGLAYAFLYQRTGSIQPAIIAHIGTVALTLMYAVGH
ncbi:CPBP family intramembrane glutamic endopeptidase [Lacticaseibacillus kribbianus]|uniref:CPBP family intramembrane glutamic endopeptidase n=1 Tax=Lacticaseibacillus kribbianus TaxID=2926292 RepID=UPI001CD767B6|nr:CPBP family intramembrane glutamic endopeptidase [Lacticaseibacillus kribbianus]